MSGPTTVTSKISTANGNRIMKAITDKISTRIMTIMATTNKTNSTNITRIDANRLIGIYVDKK